MNPILQALSQGYSVKKVLGYLSQANPEIASKVKDALAMGYPAEKVLRYIFDGGNRVIKSLPTPNQEQKSLYEDMSTSIPEGMKTAGSLALKGGALAAGAFAASQATPFLQEGMDKAADIGKEAASDLIEKTPAKEIAEQIQGASEEQIQQQAAPENIFEQFTQGVDIRGLPENRQRDLRFLETISNKLQKEGFDREDPQFRDLGKKIKDILKKPFTVAEKETMRFKKAYPETQTEEFREKAKERFPGLLERGEDVVAPGGIIGKIKSISGKNMLVEDPGTGIIKQFKANKVFTPPMPEKDLADLYTDLIGGIEKETGKDVSRNVEYAAYDPNNNELLYKSHTGNFYTYDDLPEDIIEVLQGNLKRKTAGESIIGAWEEGTESPIGAAMSKLIQRLQKERGRGKEYRGKFETIYDALEPAKIAKKTKSRIQQILNLKQKPETKLKKLIKLGLSEEEAEELLSGQG